MVVLIDPFSGPAVPDHKSVAVGGPLTRIEAECAGSDVFISKDTPPNELLIILREIRENELANLH